MLEVMGESSKEAYTGLREFEPPKTGLLGTWSW